MDKDPKKNSRYPYTYAADYLREEIGDPWDRGSPISRAEASRARQLIAKAMELDDRDVAEALADKFIEKYGV